MINMLRLAASLRLHEGVRLKPYADTVGKITIGVGRNLTDIGISPAEADLLLQNDIATALRGAESFDWFASLDQVRQNVIVELIFNLGLMRFSRFTKMIEALKERNWPGAAYELLNSTWARQVGSERSETLANMLQSGMWV